MCINYSNIINGVTLLSMGKSYFTKMENPYIDCINVVQDISMISMNVKQVYGEWYDTVSDNEIESVCILREMI